jgi:hypothetical protein
MTHNLDGSLALRLRDEVRGDLERRFGNLCVTRGLLSEAGLRRGLEEQERLRNAGEDASLVHALARLGLVDGGPVWLLLDEVLASPPEEPPGRRLGRYELIREIGKGGTGTVYKAYDARLSRVVAVKTIRPDLAEPAELVRSLVQEARTLAGLSHRNIVRVYDAGEIDGTAFLSMEFVDGHPFGEMIRRGTSIPASVNPLKFPFASKRNGRASEGAALAQPKRRSIAVQTNHGNALTSKLCCESGAIANERS